MIKPLLVFFCVLLSGCASVKVEKITDVSYKEGLRFYRPEPYLLVTQDEQNKLHTTLIYLPNKAEEYALRTTAGLGSVEMKASLTDGWNLTELGATIDSKVPEIINAFTGALQAAGGFAKRSAGLGPGLYRIDFDKTSGFATKLVGPLQ